MNLNQLTSQHLRKAIRLMERRESVQAKIRAIDQELATLLGGGGDVPIPFGRAKTRKRGALTAAILQVLKDAGPQGLRLKDIAKALGKRIGNINSWLHATGKKTKGVKRLSKGVYAWRG